MHSVARQVKSQPLGLGVQLDHDAVVVLEVRDRAAGNDRRTGGDCRIVATQIRWLGEIIDLALCSNAGAAYVNDRNAREFEFVLFLILAVIKRTVTPGVSDADRDRAAAKP